MWCKQKYRWHVLETLSKRKLTQIFVPFPPFPPLYWNGCDGWIWWLELHLGPSARAASWLRQNRREEKSGSLRMLCKAAIPAWMAYLCIFVCERKELLFMESSVVLLFYSGPNLTLSNLFNYYFTKGLTIVSSLLLLRIDFLIFSSIFQSDLLRFNIHRVKFILNIQFYEFWEMYSYVTPPTIKI